MTRCCPNCGASRYKKNGFTHTGKQNHRILSIKKLGRAMNRRAIGRFARNSIFSI